MMTYSRYKTLLFRSLILFAPCFLISSEFQPVPQQRTVKILLGGDTTRPILLSSYDEGGMTYASLDDLAMAVGLRTFWNEETKKLELKFKNYRIKVTARNPFVIITDLTANSATVYQLPVSVKLQGRRLYAPLAFFLPPFNAVFDKQVSIYSATVPIATKAVLERSPFDIANLSVEPKRNGYLVRIGTTKRFDEFESWLRPDGWLYVTIADAKADVKKINSMKGGEIFSKIVAIQYPTSVQLTFKLSKNIASSEIMSDPLTNDILLSLRLPSEADRIAAERERREMISSFEEARERWKLDVIVIDPAHGGVDPGTIGVTGVQEKKVTLSIALRLGKLIEKNLKGVKVVYTRKNDTFIELFKRGQIANAAGGKLFVSIHCNSMRRKPHRKNGFEIYLLRPGRTEEAVLIAERENAVIKLEKGYEERYQELTEENFILVTMAQSAHMKYSERFGEILQGEMGKALSLTNNGVKQAGFYVLVGASMPNVLIETAYLSNRSDEKYLKSKRGQQEIAKAIYAAVKKYRTEYEKSLEEGKASN